MTASDHKTHWHRTVQALLAVGRASEWWEYKLLPALAVGYLTCLLLGSNAWAGLSGLGWLILALVPGGIFVSVINDWTDAADDALAGKTNRLSGFLPQAIVAIIVACLAAGWGLIWLWRADALLVATYAAGWIAFTLYSVPPFRFKNRGLAGLICDATGANVVPALLATQLCARTLGQTLSAQWLAAIAIWSLMFGLRGILWHQLGDLDADRRSNTSTFVARSGAAVSIRLAKWIIFPLELVALAAMTWQVGSLAQLACGIALIIYAVLIHERIDRFEMTVTLVEPVPRSCILMHEYYDVFLPLALLLAGLADEPRVLVVLLMHLAFFPNRAGQVCADFWKLFDRQYKRRTPARTTDP